MKRYLLALVAVILLLTPIAANAIDLSSIVTEVEVSATKQDIETIKPISAGIFSISADLNSAISDVEVSSELLLIGYTVNENFTPYILLGNRNVSFERALNLNIFSHSIALTSTDVSDNDLALGVGARGKIADLPKDIKLGYDIRYSGVNIDTNATTVLIPAYIAYPIASVIEIEQRVLEASLIASKEISVQKFVKSVTPYIGVKFTEVDMNVKSTSKVGPISVSTEANYDGNMQSALAGCSVKINDNISATIGASVGSEESILAKVAYKF